MNICTDAAHMQKPCHKVISLYYINKIDKHLWKVIISNHTTLKYPEYFLLAR